MNEAKPPSTRKIRATNAALPKVLPLSQFPGTYYHFGENMNLPYEILFNASEYQRMLDHTLGTRDREVGGIVLGNVYEDDRKRYVGITHYLNAKQATERAERLTFTGETWAQIDIDQAEVAPDALRVGWVHTHPDYGIFLSTYDVWIHENWFLESYQLAYVIDPIKRLAGFFIRKANGELDGATAIPEHSLDRLPAVKESNAPPVQPEAPPALPPIPVPENLRKAINISGGNVVRTAAAESPAKTLPLPASETYNLTVLHNVQITNAAAQSTFTNAERDGTVEFTQVTPASRVPPHETARSPFKIDLMRVRALFGRTLAIWGAMMALSILLFAYPLIGAQLQSFADGAIFEPIPTEPQQAPTLEQPIFLEYRVQIVSLATASTTFNIILLLTLGGTAVLYTIIERGARHAGSGALPWALFALTASSLLVIAPLPLLAFIPNPQQASNANFGTGLLLVAANLCLILLDPIFRFCVGSKFWRFNTAPALRYVTFGVSSLGLTLVTTGPFWLILALRTMPESLVVMIVCVTVMTILVCITLFYLHVQLLFAAHGAKER